MKHFRLPDTLSLVGNLAENWRRWKQQFDIYLVTSGKNDKSDEVKAATWLAQKLSTPSHLKALVIGKLVKLTVSQERMSHGRGTSSTLGTNSQVKL